MSKFVRRYLVRFLKRDRYMRAEALKRGMIYDSLDGLFYAMKKMDKTMNDHIEMFEYSNKEDYLENGRSI